MGMNELIIDENLRKEKIKKWIDDIKDDKRMEFDASHKYESAIQYLQKMSLDRFDEFRDEATAEINDSIAVLEAKKAALKIKEDEEKKQIEAEIAREAARKAKADAEAKAAAEAAKKKVQEAKWVINDRYKKSVLKAITEDINKVVVVDKTLLETILDAIACGQIRHIKINF